MPYKNKEDQLAAQRRWYSKGDNPKKVRKLIDAKRQQRRDYLFENLGYSCVKCGSTENLEFDHINPSLKKSKQSLLSLGVSTIAKEIDNIQVLCHNCHVSRSTNQKIAAWKLFTSLPLEEQEALLESSTK